MSDAIVVNEAYKKFGSLYAPMWKRIPRASARQGEISTYAVVVAVDRVSFVVKQGEIFGVLGPGSSGKTTLIHLIATLLLPDDGHIRVFGYDVVREPVQVQRLVNRVSVEASFFMKLSPMENLVYGARLYGIGGSSIHRQVEDVLTRLGLEHSAIYQPMEEMPRSLQQKVTIARALLSRPRVLLLDEPTTGLGPPAKLEVQDAIRELREQNGTTILLSTRDATEAENLCDRVALLDGGKITALGPPSALIEMYPCNGQTPGLETVFLELTGKKLK